MKDLNANTMEAAIKIIEGTARSMGVTVVEKRDEQKKETDETPVWEGQNV